MAVSLDWFESIKVEFGAGILWFRESSPGELEIGVSSDISVEILTRLKNLPHAPFEHLADLTAYDEHPKSPRFFVVYELISMMRKQRCSVVAQVKDNESPTIRSISNQLWSGANWLEREVFDMYGINFEGHSDLRRILLPPSFKGHPLKKDFVVDHRQEFSESVNSDLGFDPFGTTIVSGSKE